MTSLATRVAGRSQLDLLVAQVDAIGAWHRARHASEHLAQAAPLSREMRLDLTRREEARRREHEALVARAEHQLRTAGGALRGRARIRAVLAHRNGWLRDAVARRLDLHDVEVVAAVEDGAEAVGILVVEQPDLVLVEDRLPTLSGVEVVRRAAEFAPDSRVAAQCLDSGGMAELLDAGARAVVTRRVPPPELADAMVGCLAADRDPLTLA